MKTLDTPIFYFFCFFALLGLSSSKSVNTLINPKHVACVTELGLDMKVVMDSHGKDFLIVEDNPDINAFSLCVFKKFNAADDNDNLKYDVVKHLLVNLTAILDPNNANKEQATADAVESCKIIQGSNAGDTAVKFNNCVVKYLSRKSRQIESQLTLQSHKDCFKELNLQPQTILDNVDNNYIAVEGNSEINAFSLCVYKKLNAVDHNDNINYDVMKNLMVNFTEVISPNRAYKKEVTANAVEACKTVRGSNPGDTTVKFNNCMTKYLSHKIQLDDNNFLQSHKDCLKELNMPIQTVIDSVGADFITVEGIPEINAFALCVYKKLNAIDANDNIRYDITKNLMVNLTALISPKRFNKKEVTVNAVEACKSVRGSNPGDTAVKFNNCMTRQLSRKSKLTESDISLPSHKDCLKELNMQPQTILDNIDEDYVMVEDIPEINAFGLCVYKKFNAVDVNDNINYDVMNRLMVNFTEVISPNRIDKEQVTISAVEHCKNVRGSNPGDTAVKFNNCVAKRLTRTAKLTDKAFTLQSHKDCFSELNLQPQDILDNVSDDYVTAEGNPEINAFAMCVYKKLNAVDNDGNIKLDTMKTLMINLTEIISPNRVDKEQVTNSAVEYCKNVRGSSPGDTAVKFSNCVAKRLTRTSKLTASDLSLQSHKDCFNELNLQPQTILDNVSDDYVTAEGIPEINAFALCVYKKLNAVDGNDNINYDVMKTLMVNLTELISPHRADREQVTNSAVEHCKTVRGRNPGDTTVKFNNCVAKRLTRTAKLSHGPFMLQSHKDCFKELNLQPQVILDNVSDDYVTAEGIPEINAFAMCTYKKLNAVDDNDNIKYDTMKTFMVNLTNLISPNRADKEQVTNSAVEYCKNVRGSSPGDTAVKFSNCVAKRLTRTSKLTASDLSLQSHKDCFNELNLQPQTILDNVSDDYVTAEGIPEINAFALCVYKKLNAVDGNDNINYDVMKTLMVNLTELISPHRADREQVTNSAVEHCKTVRGSNPGDTTVKFNNCVAKRLTRTAKLSDGPFMLQSHKDCFNELNLQPQTILDNVSDDYVTAEGIPEINAFAMCTYKKLNAVDGNDNINYDVMKTLMVNLTELISPHRADREQVTNSAVEYCKNVQGSSPGDTAVKFSNCVAKRLSRTSKLTAGDLSLQCHKDCFKELSLQPQTILDYISDDYVSAEGIPEINAFALCVYKKLNAVDDKNNINYDVMKTLMVNFTELISPNRSYKKQVTASAVESCKTVRGSNPGDTVIKFNNCMARRLSKKSMSESELFAPGNKDCLKELNLQPQTILDNVYDDNMIVEGIPEVNAFALCITRKLNALDVNDSIKYDAVKILLVNVTKLVSPTRAYKKEIAANAVESCKTVRGSSPGDTLVKFNNCVTRYLTFKFDVDGNNFQHGHRDCLKDLNMQLQTVLDSVGADYVVVEGIPEINAYSLCVYKKFNAVDENDNIKYDYIKNLMVNFTELISPDRINKKEAAASAVEACKTVRGSNQGDTVVKFSNCVARRLSRISKLRESEFSLPSHKDCLKELNLQAQFLLDNLDDDYVMVEGIPEINAFGICVYKKLNAVDDNYNIKYDVMKTLLIKLTDLISPNGTDNAQSTANAVEACESVRGSNPGDTAVKFSNCVTKYLSRKSKLEESFFTQKSIDCLKELSLDARTVLDHVSDDYIAVEGNPEVNAFSLCVHKKTNVIDSNDNINYEVMKDLMLTLTRILNPNRTDQELITANAVESCKAIRGNNVGDTTVKFHNCVVRYLQSH